MITCCLSIYFVDLEFLIDNGNLMNSKICSCVLGLSFNCTCLFAVFLFLI